MSDYNIPTPEERRQQRLEQNDPAGKSNRIMRAIFGIIMIIIYVGMGVLLLINFFNWGGDWAWTRYVVGVVLIIYGLWRAYRQVKGID
ncbi:MAG: hypothetical protein K2F91_03405 [Muribaculaceae bacterium]|nr:hypothetical protein [Muribaculaceae bacterium]